MAESILIIGAGIAGTTACVKLREFGYQGAIVLAGEEVHLPYDRPPLSKASLVQDETPNPVLLMSEASATELDIDVRTNSRAVSINRVEKITLFDDGSSLSYDKLLLATGAKPRKLTIPGGEHALLLRNFDDVLALREGFLPGKSIVIVGGGFIGLELAASAISKGCKVTLIEAQPRILMRGVPEVIAGIIHETHAKYGVNLLIGTGISQLSATNVILADGREVHADTIIAGIGAAPETKLAADAGLEIDNGISCNAFMQTSDPDIYAVGDCASFIHSQMGNRRIRLEAWRSAQDQAATAAENMLGGAKSHSAQPWFWSDQHDLGLQIVGMADMGLTTIARRSDGNTLILFHLTEDGKLMGASGIGIGNAVARDIKIAEMLIAKGASPSQEILGDAHKPLKKLLKG